jgi:hypothetical protein
MIPLDVVVRRVLPHGVAQMTFAQRDNLGQTLGLDRLDESVRVGVPVLGSEREASTSSRPKT